MSFGFGSGGGGFGQNNQASSFGSSAFGGNNNTGGGFGSTGTPAFGSGNTGTTGGSLFGGNTTSSFGSGGGGAFGTNTNNNQQAGSVFGQQQNRPGGFGTTNTTTPAAGGMFGGANNASTGNTTFGSGGGFGSGTTAGAFGTNTNTNTGGGLFGKTAAPSGFGTSNTTGGFGSGGGGFGATNTTTPSTGFGSTGTAFQGALAPCEGTGSTPFTPFTEKDANTSATNHYHSISFMQPYSKFSFEELRLADYQQGRRFGNGSGQGAGAFGSTAFGSSTGGGFGTQQNTGFGTSTTTPFGGAAATSAPGAFGQTQTTGAFGSSNSNPLFGGAKPATPMFGSTPTTGAAQPSGFGAGNTTGGAFGNTGSTGAFGNTGNSLFGQNTQQNKPAFGAPAATNTAGAFGGFGSQQTTAPANAFGSTTATAPAFGQQQTGTNTLGGFGAQNQTQNKPGGLFGSGTGGGFGSSTTQPNTGGGLFGGGNTSGTGTSGGGLFGQQQNQQQQQQPAAGGGLFGGGQSTNTGGGLFGSSQTQQPAKPAGGLFGGGSSTGTGSTFGGFGASQPQQNTGGGLFGNTQNQQQQKPGGMFGSTSGTGGLFNQSSTGQNTGGSLFGSQNQQQQPANNSMFGGSQPAQQQPQQPVPGSLTSSLLDGNPYGSQSIFSGLPGPNAPSPGPLATPLSVSQKQKRRTPLPVYNMTPGAANRLITPPKRNQGYGFSYSTYGSPSSASSTPGFSNSLLGSGPSSGSLRGSVGGSFGRSFSKSYSTSNLRNSFNPDSDSVLSPGALQVGSGRGGSDKLKRLQIDRSLRNDLFTRPSSSSPAPITNGEDASQSSDKLKKKVSFDSTSPGVSGGELVRVESKSPEPTPQELGFLRSTRKSGSLNGIDTVDRPEMESLNLAVVPENGEPVTRATTTSKRLVTVPGSDPKPGEYWMKPSFAELSKLSRDQLRRVVDFTVGRQNCGEVTFNGPVDLNGTDLSDLFGTIVDIGLRKITVYPDEATKPPMGKGLNVPSTLRIENSWPRGRDKKKPAPITSGPLFDKHIDRLQKVTDTEFVDYEVDTGTWVFIVPHFTTYGLDYDEDEEGESLDQSTMSAGPDNHTPKPQRDHPVSFEQSATFSIDESFVGSMAGMDDDTFDFKKHKLVPGSFGNQAMAIEDHDMVSEGETESFLEEGSAGSIIEHDDDVTVSQHSGDSMFGSDEREEMDMAGSFPNIHRTVEHDDDQSSILDTTQPMFKHFGTPPKPSLNLSGDWTEQLQRTISPRKQNRDALREIQANAFTDRHLLNDDSPSEKMASPKKGFTNSIDLMNSLFQQQPKKQNTASQMNASKSQPKGFEWPYPKQPKTFADDTTPMDQKDLAFHESFKPRWGPMDSIVCAKGDFTAPIEGTGNRWNERFSIFSEGRDVAVMDYSQPTESKEMLDIQRQQSTIQRVDGTPLVRMAKIDLRQFALSHGTEEERLIWQLTNILFNDDIEDDISAGVPPQLRSQFAHRIKKDRLTRLWKGIIRDRHAHDLDRIRSPEERAVHLLCSHRVEEACKTLVDSQNIHLATLVAQIGRDATSRTDMAKQIEVWRQNNVLSEMTEPVRALYELVAGNGLRSEGKSGGALEDRASSFGFTDRFELDWLQAFGLRLWYSTTEDEPIETAVAKFLDDLATGLEPAFPHPAHRAGTRAAVQPGSDTVGRESPLWVLLKIYSGVNGNAKIPSIELPAALLPESLSGDVLSNRLSFQFHHVLATVVGQSNAVKINQVQTDRLVWDYASELIASGELAPALFVLLHLSQPDDRKRAVQETLARFGPHLPDPTLQGDAGPDAAWQHLTTDLQLPDAWIWVAKALDARDRGDAIREVDCLIRGRHWNDAHATFCRVVGPTTIISRDYHTLDQLVTGFGEGPERKMRGWSSGGGVYEDFLRLATAPRGRRDPTRLSRLVNALVAMGDRVRTGSGIDGLEERVAFKEMSRTLAGWMTHEDVQSIDSSSALRLPLTGDARMQQTLEISRRYYGTIMAGGF